MTVPDPRPGGAPTERAVAAWSAALDEIERSLTADPSTPLHWVAPADLGPIPTALVPRAELVLAAVDGAHAEVAAAAAVAFEELDALSGATPGQGPSARRRAPLSVEPPLPRLVDHDA